MNDLTRFFQVRDEHHVGTIEAIDHDAALRQNEWRRHLLSPVAPALGQRIHPGGPNRQACLGSIRPLPGFSEVPASQIANRLMNTSPGIDLLAFVKIDHQMQGSMPRTPGLSRLKTGVARMSHTPLAVDVL